MWKKNLKKYREKGGFFFQANEDNGDFFLI